MQGTHHELGDLADPADVLLPVLGAEAQVAVQAVADVVAVQQRRQPAVGCESMLQRDGNRALA